MQKTTADFCFADLHPADVHPIDHTNPRKARCFGCGQANPYGLQMTFSSDEDRIVTAKLTVPSHLCGWNNLTHGGIISAILDEIMGTTGIYLLQSFIMTKTMTVCYHRPVPVAVPLDIRGEITEKTEKYVHIKGGILDEKKTLLASATGEFRIFTEEQFATHPVMETISRPPLFTHPATDGS